MKTDAEIRANPYFDHWRYDGKPWQRALHVGPKSAMYKPLLAPHVAKAIEEEDEGALTSMKMAFAAGTQIYDPESRKTVSPTRWWLEFAEGRKADYDQLYRASPWAYRCIQIKSEALAGAPWQVVNRAGDMLEAGPLWDLLRQPNPEQTFEEMLRGTCADLDVYGKAFWLKIEKGPFLQRLNPKRVELLRPSGVLAGFRYNGTRTLALDEVAYFRSYNPGDDIEGLSPLEICRQAVNVDAAASSHLADFFDNHAMPAYIMSADTTDQSELNRMAAIWKQMYGRKGVRGGTAFVGGKAEPKEMGYAPEKLALKDIHDEARKSICATLGVPPAVVGAWEAANYAAAREQRASLYTEAVMPRGEYIAQVLNADIAAWLGDDRFEWEWSELPVMQEDEGKHAERLALLVEKNILKPEVAALELGYDEGDVPEPAPIPDQLLPFVPKEAGGQQGGRQPEKPEEPAEEELGKWRKKALRRLKDGKSPAAVFKSEAISERLAAFVMGALEECKTAAEVDRAFAKARAWRSYP